MITPFLVPPPPLFLFYCTWMLLTELCLFTPIGFSTVHAQVSVNINYFYQDLQCAEWLAKRVYCKRQMKMRESKVTWMLNFQKLLRIQGEDLQFHILNILQLCGPKTRLLCLVFLVLGLKQISSDAPPEQQANDFKTLFLL